MDTLANIHAWLIWEEELKGNLLPVKAEESEIPNIQNPLIPVLAILILILTPLADLHPAIAAQLLRRGSQGQNVVALQNSLKRAGCFSGRSTGYFGRVTERSVRRLQRTHGLRVDGIVGRRTRRVLRAGKGCNLLVSSRVLKIGSRGERVRQLQESLNVYGFPIESIDGIFGKETLAAVINFQNYYSLKPDGIVGSKTTKSLKRMEENEIINGSGYGILTPQGFKTLENALYSSDKETRYWAATILATQFQEQSDFRCVGVKESTDDPCKQDPINLVIIALDKRNESQVLQYKEVELPVGRMQSIINEALEEKDKPLLQVYAAVAQTWIRKPPTKKVVDILLKNLNNPDKSISDQAFSSLELIASNGDYVKYLTPKAVETLIDIFQDANSVQKVFKTLNYLAANGNKQALETLESFLPTGNGKTTSYGYSVLSSIDYSDFASIVGKVKAGKVVKILKQVIENKKPKNIEENIRSGAIEALTKIDFKQNQQLKNQAIDTLKKVLHTSVLPEVRFEAARSLAEIGIPKNSPLQNKVIETLKNVLQNKQNKEINRFYAAKALGKVGGQGELDILKKVLLEKNKPNADENFDPIADVSFGAASALAEIGGEEGKAFLKKVLSQSKTPDPLRINVALAVSKFDLNSALSALIAMYKKDPKIIQVYSPDCALTNIGKPAIQSLQKEGQEYRRKNLQKQSKITEQIIKYIENPSINFAFNPCGGIGDDPDAIRSTFIASWNSLFKPNRSSRSKSQPSAGKKNNRPKSQPFSGRK